MAAATCSGRAAARQPSSPHRIIPIIVVVGTTDADPLIAVPGHTGVGVAVRGIAVGGIAVVGQGPRRRQTGCDREAPPAESSPPAATADGITTGCDSDAAGIATGHRSDTPPAPDANPSAARAHTLGGSFVGYQRCDHHRHGPHKQKPFHADLHPYNCVVRADLSARRGFNRATALPFRRATSLILRRSPIENLPAAGCRSRSRPNNPDRR